MGCFISPGANYNGYTPASEVIDRGEWTDKKLTDGSSGHTKIVPCGNIIFIMTTNSATELICEHASRSNRLHTGDAHPADLEEEQMMLESNIRQKLMRTNPFTDAFIGRVDRVVPFFPMARGGPDNHPLMDESLAIAKMLIEQEQNKMKGSSIGNVEQFVDAKTKHAMARLAIMESIPEAGVRSIQKIISTKMGNRMKHALLVEQGGIVSGSSVRYSANEELKKVDWQVLKQPAQNEPPANAKSADPGTGGGDDKKGDKDGKDG